MKFITRVVIVDIKYTTNKISQFYFNAKRNKYNHTYGYEDVFKDIQLAYQDRQLYPSNKTIQKWIDNGFDVARNKRGWAFAYTIDNNVMLIHDVENCRNLTLNSDNTDTFVIQTKSISITNKQCVGIGYQVSACRLEDGYIYLYKNKQRLPNFRFNEIIKPFYRYKNGEIYAIGLYGDKKYKITLDGIAKALQEARIHNITKQIILEIKRNLIAS